MRLLGGGSFRDNSGFRRRGSRRRGGDDRRFNLKRLRLRQFVIDKQLDLIIAHRPQFFTAEIKREQATAGSNSRFIDRNLVAAGIDRRPSRFDDRTFWGVGQINYEVKGIVR